jgi:hypothetical protein
VPGNDQAEQEAAHDVDPTVDHTSASVWSVSREIP